MNFNIQLESLRVMLRPLVISDLDVFEELTKDKDMWYYFTSDLSNKIELENWVKDAIRSTHEGKRLAFAVVDKINNVVIGSTSFGNIAVQDKRVEIGWTWIAKTHRGTGINDSMKYLMLQYCFEANNFERVEFKTDILNRAARKALTRIGATEEGILRSHTLMVNNRRRDTIYYSVLRDEWKLLKNRSS